MQYVWVRPQMFLPDKAIIGAGSAPGFSSPQKQLGSTVGVSRRNVLVGGAAAVAAGVVGGEELTRQFTGDGSGHPAAVPVAGAGERQARPARLIGDGSTSYTGPQPFQPKPERLAPGERPPQFVVFSWDGAGEDDKKLFSHFRQVAQETKATMSFFLSGIYMLPRSQKMLYAPPGPNLSRGIGVVHVTLHMALRDTFANITTAAVLEKIELLHAVMKKLCPDPPRLAAAALNPHASDGGLFGDEERQIIAPAVERAQAAGIDVVGPLPSDTLFVQAQRGRFDGVVAMYHDQGLIPFKSLALGEGVNYTAGLPMVRTSPDHGTAFDIAGKNKADGSSFLASIYTCLDIIHSRQEYEENRKNPLKKMGAVVLANAVDEKIEEN